MSLGEVLFSGTRMNAHATLSRVLQHRLGEMAATEVNGIRADRFSAATDDQLVEQVRNKLRIEPLQLRREDGTGSVSETMIPLDNVLGSGGIKAKGLSVVQSVPFSGEKELWRLRPDQYDMNPPAGEIRDSTVVVGIAVREAEQERAVDYIKKTLDSIQTYIGRQNEALAEYNGQLEAVIRPLITARRTTLQNASDLSGRLKGL